MLGTTKGSILQKSNLKLIIQIPCYNEEESLPVALAALPRKLRGVADVEWLIIDDGSKDSTAEVAKSLGVDHIVRLPQNRGLAKAFMAGIEACLLRKADIIVNTDADNQYCAEDIPKLIEPILAGRAEFVIGERPIEQIEHFSPIKKILQRFGSRVVAGLSGVEVKDAPSGFRAMSRATAQELNVISEYTYTLETLIQAGQKGIAIESVPIRVNGMLRPSRLMRSIPEYVAKSMLTMLRIHIIYRPVRLFGAISLAMLTSGMFLGIRYLAYWLMGNGEGKVQSLILTGLLISSAFIFGIAGILADLISANRKLIEKNQRQQQKFQDQLPREHSDDAAA